MVDYLYSRNTEDASSLKNALLYFREDCTETECNVSTGSWGCLVTVGKPYPHVPQYEDSQYILLVLGGALPADVSTIEQGRNDFDIPQWLLAQMTTGKINWQNDLFGAFQVVLIDKVSGQLTVTTDIASFVPGYFILTDEKKSSNSVFYGSHADAVALAAGVNSAIDKTSIAEFLVYQTTTYPYTFYQTVHQLPPACITTCAAGNVSYQHYWQPVEKKKHHSVQEEASQLRNIIARHVQAIEQFNGPLTIFMSGGEDSRVVISALPKTKKHQAVTLSDSYNREAKIAQKVSAINTVDWQLVTRSVSHYLDHARRSVKLSESHNLFYHAHFHGFTDLEYKKPVIGGLMADAFCKGSHAMYKRVYNIATERLLENWVYIGTSKKYPVSSDLNIKASQRREQRNNDLKEMRPVSWAEWHSLYPATMNTNVTNYFVNRRLYFSYEPFADAQVVTWSASVNAHDKINRKLFHLAMKPLLESTRFIRHGKGIFPYWGTWFNGPLLTVVLFARKVILKLKKKLNIPVVNEGAWPIWKEVVGTAKFQELSSFQSPSERQHAENLLGGELLDLVEKSMRDKDPVQALAGLQIKLWVESIEQKCSK